MGKGAAPAAKVSPPAKEAAEKPADKKKSDPKEDKPAAKTAPDTKDKTKKKGNFFLCQILVSLYFRKII